MKSNSKKSHKEDCVEKKVVIKNELGLHARPAALFVQTSSKFECEIFVKKQKEDQEVNGKSIMGLMMLAAGPGTHLVLKASGADAEDALSELEKLIDSKFGE